MASGQAAAENPLKPGDDVVPVRHFADGVLIEAPQKGYEGTCWRVLAADQDSVDVALVNGVFRPHWEDYAPHRVWSDRFTVGSVAPFPSDKARRRFSIFEAVAVCPSTDGEPPKLESGEHLIQIRHFDRKQRAVLDGADKGEAPGCWEVLEVSEEGARLKHKSGVLRYWWNDGEETAPGGEDLWFSSNVHKEHDRTADNLTLLRKIFRPVKRCPK